MKNDIAPLFRETIRKLPSADLLLMKKDFMSSENQQIQATAVFDISVEQLRRQWGGI